MVELVQRMVMDIQRAPASVDSLAVTVRKSSEVSIVQIKNPEK